MESVEEILAMTEPYELFTKEESRNRSKRNELIKYYHPDTNGGGAVYADVIAQINKLYEVAEEALKNGIWIDKGFIECQCQDGKRRQIKFTRSYSFELGTCFIGGTVVLYLIKKEHKEFVDQMERVLNNLNYADRNMETEFTTYLPQIISTYCTLDGSFGIVLKKTEDLYTLDEILQYHSGKIDAKGVAWILSSLYNLLCFFEYNQIAHNGITVHNYFISPKNHYGALLGGWWYSMKQQAPLLGVSEEIYDLMDPRQKEEPISDSKLDLEAVHAIGRKLLGDASGITLGADRKIPRELVEWLRGPCLENAFIEYDYWNQVLMQSFGRRSFTPMPIDKDRMAQIIGGK